MSKEPELIAKIDQCLNDKSYRMGLYVRDLLTRAVEILRSRPSDSGDELKAQNWEYFKVGWYAGSAWNAGGSMHENPEESFEAHFSKAVPDLGDVENWIAQIEMSKPLMKTPECQKQLSWFLKSIREILRSKPMNLVPVPDSGDVDWEGLITELVNWYTERFGWGRGSLAMHHMIKTIRAFAAKTGEPKPE